MRLRLKNSVALNLWNDGGVHAEMRIISKSKVYSGMCMTADQLHSKAAYDDVDIFLSGDGEKLLIELYHVHTNEGKSYVGNFGLDISAFGSFCVRFEGL